MVSPVVHEIPRVPRIPVQIPRPLIGSDRDPIVQIRYATRRSI